MRAIFWIPITPRCTIALKVDRIIIIWKNVRASWIDTLTTLKVDRATLVADMTDLKSRAFQSIFQSLNINPRKRNQNIEELGLLAICTRNWLSAVKDRTEKQGDKFILRSKTSKKKKRESMKKSKNLKKIKASWRIRNQPSKSWAIQSTWLATAEAATVTTNIKI